MDGYNFTEIGMLVGAAIGGILSVIGFMLWHSTITFSFAFAGIALGIWAEASWIKIKKE